MIRVTLYKNETPWTTINDVDPEMASAYAQYAQLCGYGILIEEV